MQPRLGPILRPSCLSVLGSGFIVVHLCTWLHYSRGYNFTMATVHMKMEGLAIPDTAL